MHAAPMLCSPMRLPAPPLSNVPRAIHRELGASRLIGGGARRWRRRPILTNLCCVTHAIHLPVRLAVLADAFACSSVQRPASHCSYCRSGARGESSHHPSLLACACASLQYAVSTPASGCEGRLRCIGSSGRILPSAGKDGRCDGRAPNVRTFLCASPRVCLHHLCSSARALNSTESRPNQYIQGKKGERCLEAGESEPELADSLRSPSRPPAAISAR